MPETYERMQTHVKVVAALFIIGGVLNLFAALLFGLGFGIAGMAVGMSNDPDAAVALPILGLVGAFVVVLMLLLSVPAIAVGVALLKYREWARIAGIVIAALMIFHVPPIGTVFGIYALWVLLNSETARLMGDGPRPPAVRDQSPTP